MSESFSIHQISTTPIPFGVSIKWKWPEASYWFSRLELQYLLSNGHLVKELIRWPVTEKRISGLKAGEHLQVRLRPVAADGSSRDWGISDWLNCASSVDAGEMIQALQDDILSSATFGALDGIADLPLYSISSDRAIQQKIADALDTALASNHVQCGNSEPDKTPVVFLAERWVALEGKYTAEEMRDALEYIKRNRMTKALGKSLAESSPFAIKAGQVFIKDAFIGNGIKRDESGHVCVAGKGVAVEDGKEQVEFKAEKFAVAANTQNALETALHKVIKKVVDETLRQAMQPGGTIWRARAAR